MGINNLLQNKMIICFLLLVIVVGLLIIRFLDNPSSKTRVLYVSQDEIISYEKERLERLTDETKIQLFNGRPEKAASLIEDIAGSFEDENNKVVFSRGFVSGQDVSSISQDVHTILIQRLKASSVEKD